MVTLLERESNFSVSDIDVMRTALTLTMISNLQAAYTFTSE